MKPLFFSFLFILSTVTYSSLLAQSDNIIKKPISITNDPLNLIPGSLFRNGRQDYLKANKSNLTNSGGWTNQYGPFGIVDAYGVAVEPDTGNLVFAGTLRGLLRSTNGGNTWQYFGGFSSLYQDGPISAIAIDPTNSNKIIAGDGTNQFMKIYISEDRGLTWIPVNHPSSEQCIDISKTNPNRVVTGSNSFSNQLAKSTNGGYNWSSISLSYVVTGRVWTVRFHPLNADKIFAGGEKGLFYSNDFGTTWTELNNGIPNINNIGIRSIDFSPTNPDSIVVSCESSYGPYISADGGTSWTEIRNNLYQYEICWRTHFPLWDSKDLLTGTFYSGLMKSWVPNIYWQSVWPLNLLNPGSIEDITTTKNHKVFIGSRYNGVFKSSDGGTTYEEANNGATCADMRAVKINPHNTNEALCAGWSGGVYKTVNYGNSWQKVQTGGYWLSVDIASSNSNICFAAGCYYPSMMKSIDGGQTWDYSTNGFGDYSSFIKVAIDPNDANHVIALSHYGSDHTVYQTYNGGTLWQPITGIPANAGAYYVHEVVFDYRTTTPYIYVGTDNGLYNSTNNGQTWSQVFTASPESMGLTTINNVPILYGLSTTSVYFSNDHGVSWTVLFNSPSGNNLSQCVINKLNSNEIVLFDENCYCFFSTNGGQTWEDQSLGIPYDYISNLDIDFESKTRYIATEGRGAFSWNDSTAYIITAICNPANGGSVSGAGTYYHGQNLTLVANPAIGFAFVNWTENDSIVSTSTTYNSFVVNHNRSLVANFRSVLAIMDLSRESVLINIFPNPGTNYINIDLSKLNIYNQDIKAEMYDFLGKSIAINNTLTTKSIIPLDITGIPSGLYYLIIKTKENVLCVKKIIITKE